MKDKKPDKLYKYVGLDTLNIILKNQTLKFSSPIDFNDPFDCDVDLLDFDFNGKVDFQVAQEIEIIKVQFQENKEFSSMTHDKTFWQQVYKGAQKEKIKNCRISCFSTQNDIILMWSHYANKHNGACLEFNNSEENRFINLVSEDITEGEVGYESQKRINYVTEDRHFAIYKLFLNKSESWKHEREYRMILIDNKPEIQKFHPKFLATIYFGVNVTESQIKLFIEKYSSTPEFQHLKYYKGIKNNLSVKFKQIKNK